MWRPALGRRLLLTAAALLPAWRSAWTALLPGGALLAGKPCVGVLGTAIDVNYPAANSLLIDDVASAGAVISEFPPLYPTKPENFPRRNRIISGLSCGACIVEAPVRSGALITANLALEQGRDVFAVPGNIDSPNSTGTNALIRDGAKAITGAQDILSEYEGLYPGRIQYDTELYSPPKRAEKVSVSAKTEIDKPQTIPYSDLESRLTEYTEDHRALLRCISRGETHVDEMSASTGFSAAKVLACMTVLTIRGAVKPLPGKRYSFEPEVRTIVYYGASKKDLVIVESPAKARTIEKYLGGDYKVIASMGHLRDLPKSKLGVDIEHGFTPEYIPVAARSDVINELKKRSKEAGTVYLATDPDREGEAISWHLKRSF